MAHGSKSSNPVINEENDQELILADSATLAEAQVGHETELSYFRMQDYLEYKENPSSAW